MRCLLSLSLLLQVRGGDDPDVKFKTKQWTGPAVVQGQSTKKPAEMDIVANGMAHQVRTFAAPNHMTMNDHDHGLVWPPPMGVKQTPFMSMVKEKPEHAGSVNGIMVGYKGHVPRARDKVGGCPLGGMAGVARSEGGFPVPESTVPTALPGMGTQTSLPTGENPLYVSTSHAVQFQTAAAAAGMAGGAPHKVNQKASGDGIIPRYSGHKPGASTKGIGGSIYGTKNGVF